MPAKKETVPDPRHKPIRDHIAELYSQHNDGLSVPWSGHTATVLAYLLKHNYGWTLERFIICVDNRFNSENVNVAADPLDWLNSRERLVNYAAGPLDRFGRPMRVKVVGRESPALDAWGSRIEREAAEELARIGRLN